jgi:DNA-directed RNA polymerase subunit L
MVMINMKIEFLKNTENEIEFKLIDGDVSIVIPLVTEIQQDPEVYSAQYFLTENDSPRVLIKVKEGSKAIKILKYASQKMSKKYAQIYDSFVLGSR